MTTTQQPTLIEEIKSDAPEFTALISDREEEEFQNLQRGIKDSNKLFTRKGSAKNITSD